MVTLVRTHTGLAIPLKVSTFNKQKNALVFMRTKTGMGVFRKKYRRV
jgi:hypothetical protein